MLSYTIIYNPASGHSKGPTAAEQLKTKLEDRQHQVTMAPTKSADDAREFAYHAQADIVVAVGGDGTINQVVAGLAPRKNPPLLAILPEGTVNNLAKVLHIPLLLPLAIKNIFEAAPQPLDVAQVNNHYMVSTLTLGVLANAALSVTQKEKQHFGPIIYLMKGFKVLAQHQHWILQLDSADGKWQKDTQFLLITMTNSVGGFINAVPDAAPDDGRLHVFLAPKLTLWRSLLAIPYFITGNFQKLPGMTYFATKELTIKTPKTLQSRIDGDPSTKTPLTLKVISDHIQVLAPNVG